MCDIEHMFCTCQRVSEVWKEIRNKLSRIVSNNISNADLIRLNFPVNTFNNEIVWIISSYVYKIWESNYCQENLVMSRGNLFGFLKYKFKRDLLGARVQLKSISGLFDLS